MYQNATARPRVQVVQPREDHPEVGARQALVERPKLVEQARDGAARAVLEHDRDDAVDVVALHAEVAHDVGVRERREASHFDEERLGRLSG